MDYKLTSYEKARVIGTRATLISMGSQPMINMSLIKTSDPIKIAEEELNQGLLPMIITRTFPDGTKREIKLSE